MTLSNESQHESSMHSRLHRNAQIKSTCFVMYLSLNSRYQFPHRCFTSWRCTFRTSQSFRYSIARLTIRLYVISEVNRSSNLDSFVSAIFASMYDLALQNLRYRESLLENFRQYIAEEALEVTSLRKSAAMTVTHKESVALGKLARKLQNTHRWGSFRTHRSEGALDIRNYIVEGACAKASDIMISAQAEDTDGCCEEVLKRQPSQWQMRKSPFDRNRRKKN